MLHLMVEDDVRYSSGYHESKTAKQMEEEYPEVDSESDRMRQRRLQTTASSKTAFVF